MQISDYPKRTKILQSRNSNRTVSRVSSVGIEEHAWPTDTIEQRLHALDSSAHSRGNCEWIYRTADRLPVELSDFDDGHGQRARGFRRFIERILRHFRTRPPQRARTVSGSFTTPFS